MQGLLSTCCALDSGSVEGAAAGALLPAQKKKKRGGRLRNFILQLSKALADLRRAFKAFVGLNRAGS